MGTPTYTPPAWLTEGYPEVLRVSFDGKPLVHGSRRHYNYTSPIYQRKCQSVIEALAEHYKDHLAVIGWQIDNELNCHVDASFSESDHAAFRAWCKERYGTLDALNKAWAPHSGRRPTALGSTCGCRAQRRPIKTRACCWTSSGLHQKPRSGSQRCSTESLNGSRPVSSSPTTPFMTSRMWI